MMYNTYPENIYIGPCQEFSYPMGIKIVELSPINDFEELFFKGVIQGFIWKYRD